MRPYVVALLLSTAAGLARAQTFTDIGAGLPGVEWGAAGWADYDSDGDLDILLTGWDGSQRIARVYRSDAGTLTDIAAGLPGVRYSATAWGDYDNDGDLDLLLTGLDGAAEAIARVYRNDAGGFTDIAAGLPGVYSGSATWGDHDNDGDLDVLLTGNSGSQLIARVYRNDGGVFTDAGAGLPGLSYGSAAWGDYDDDGDLDLLLTGSDGSQPVARVYRNDAGAFSDVAAGLPGVELSSAAWGDFDNDGDLDILLAGGDRSQSIARVYRNVAGAFTDASAGLAGVSYSAVAWGDHDNDGDLDILLNGWDGSQSITRLYSNVAGTFTETSAGLPGADSGSVAWGDYDNDGDLDVLVSGVDYLAAARLARVYRNDGGAPANTLPAAPAGLAATAGGRRVALSWAAASDDETPAAGLSYNLRVGTSPGASDVVSPMAASDGRRHIGAIGNVQHGTTAWLDGLPIGTFYWSVQAVDTGFAASAFSQEGSFTTGGQTAWHGWFAVDPLETPMVGDFDGDGRADIITFTRQNPLAVGDVYVALSNGRRFVDRSGNPDSSDKWHDWFSISTDETVVVGDYDGDGRDDIATWLGKTTRQAYVALSLGAGMTKESVWADAIGFDPTDVLLAGDVNADRMADLVCFARRQGKVYVALSDGARFGAPTEWHGFFAVSTYERPRVADVDGDGRADIVTFATDSPSAQGDVYVALSNGLQFTDANGVPGSSTKWHDWFAVQPTEKLGTGDLDADGRDDFFTFLPPPLAQCYTVRSTGSGMGENELWRHDVAPLATDVPHVGDADGDGKADIIVFAQAQGKVYVSLAP